MTAQERRLGGVRVGESRRGPPRSGNGGYVAGLTTVGWEGPALVRLSAPIPLEEDLELTEADGVRRLTTRSGLLLAEARAGLAPLEAPPAVPDMAAARAAGRRFPGLTRAFHPVCFTCSPHLADGEGLKVFVGDLTASPPEAQTDPSGVGEGSRVAGVWSPHPAFADAGGRLAAETIWAALDCPGSVAWLSHGGGAGLLGSMTAEIHFRPTVDQALIVLGWPIERSGRKRVSGTALFSQGGELLAQSRQVWITPAAPP